ncbi:MAG TPA: hypothetical protein VLK88_11220 [Gemmatimonadales bacterium]|nr:hypothetical protein [Gemmatimonadales bacterium]
MPGTILRRNLLFTAAIVGGLVACSDSGTNPNIPATVTVAAVAATDNQSGVAGTRLSQGLQVKVMSDGHPKAGIAVEWETSDGTVIPALSRTDSRGIATTIWTLGRAPGVMTVSAVVSGAQGSPVTFSATAPVTVTVDPPTDGQIGVVGATLTQPLRVTVRSDGTPSAGVAVTWVVSGGTITPASSITDDAGIATATWTLGHIAGVGQAWVKIPVSLDPVGFFTATALPGPAAVIAKVGGDAQTVPANRATFSSLIALVTDQYDNRVQGAAVTWSVESGPVTFVTMGSATDAGGRSAAMLAPNGTVGGAVVRAALPGGTPAVTFTLTVGPPAPYVVIVRTNYSNSTPDAFLSAQNGTTNPAVDTIPAGATMEWRVIPWDYFLYYGRDLVPVGQPSFPLQHYPPDDPSTVSVTFTVPGTYHYADNWSPGGAGIIVVQ